MEKEARNYATLVNRENRWGKEIGSQQVRTGMPKKPNFLDRAADFLTDAWNRNAEAESVNSGLAMEQGLKTGEKARKVFDSAGQAMAAQSEMNRQGADGAAKEIKEQTKKAAKHWGDANAAYSEAQTEQANKTGEFAERTKQHWANANKSYSEAHNEHAQRIGEQATEASRKYGEMWALTSGVTGSDQTGASVWGYRKDKQMSEPRSDWDVAARKEYRTLKRTDPKAAEAFAVEVNEGLNRAERERKAGALQEWVSESGAHGVAAWVGGRGLNQISPLDSYNKRLERAAIGVNRENPELTATDIKEIIDDTNAGNIEERFGKIGGWAYTAGTNLTDELISKGLLGKKGKGRVFSTDDFVAAAGAFEAGYGSAEKEGKTGGQLLWPAVVEGGAVLLGAVTSEGIEKKLSKVSNETAKKVIGDAAGKAVEIGIKVGSDKWFDLNRDEIDRMTEEYMTKKKIPRKRAQYKAIRELMEKEGKR